MTRRAPKTPTIVGTGLVALDIVVGRDGQAHQYAGGTCGNVLTVLASLGWSSYPIARIAEDAAGTFVAADMVSWGVRTELLRLTPQARTPVIVQRIHEDADGRPYHTFSWACRACGARFPSYQAVRLSGVPEVLTKVPHPDVYFFDRVSPAALSLAKAYAKVGTLVVFEPSAVGEPRLFSAAMECAHVIKYSEERMRTLGTWISDSQRSPDLVVEIETLGAAGLRYRVGPSARRWFSLNAYLVEDLRDTAGAGDWCTAGFLNAFVRGRASGGDVSRTEIRTALEVGQALAAWNCGFEAARGAMYATVARGAPVPIRTILASARKSSARHPEPPSAADSNVCAACTGAPNIADSGEPATRQ